MSIYPGWFRALRSLVRVFARKTEVRGADKVQEPCVFITRHLNNYGPVAVYLHMPFEFHTWSLHVFFDRKSAYHHLSEFTFHQRAGMPRWLACSVAYLISAPISLFYHAIGMIPVYRGLKTVMKTMSATVDVLEAGENALIMADVNYAAEGDDVGELYTGFIHLGKLYYRRTGKRLRFVPLSINRREGYLRLGDPIAFDPSVPFPQEKERIAACLVRELSDDH